MKKILNIITILLIMVSIEVKACELGYDEYKEKGIVQSFIVGEYVFNVDNGYSPSLEDFAEAARSIKDGEEVKVYNIIMIGDIYYKVREVLSNTSTTEKSEFPYIDVTYEYRNHIYNASEEDYTIYTCPDKNIKVQYTGLYTEGTKEYKTKAIRYASIETNKKIEEVKYCTTIKEECEPNVSLGEKKSIEIEYETNISAQKVCIEAKSKIGETSGVVCDTEQVKVDKEYIKLKDVNEEKEIVEGKPKGLNGLFEVTYSVSGGNLRYYSYQDEEKMPINDMSDLKEGLVTIEIMASGGNGLVSTEVTDIEVKKNTVTYDVNGGESVEKNSEKVIYNEKADLSVKATKEGYEFIGWNTEKNATSGLDNIVVKEDITLYAIYEKTLTGEFIVTKNGNITPAVSEYSITTCKIYGNEQSCKIKIPTISAKSGYKVSGWNKIEYSTTPEYVGGEEIEISENIRMYSVSYEKRGITATFITYDGEKAKENVLTCYKYNGADTCEIDPSELVNEKYKGLIPSGYTSDLENVSKVTDFTLSEGKKYYVYYEKNANVNFISENKNINETIKTTYVVTLNEIKKISEYKEIPEMNQKDGYEKDGYRLDKESLESEITNGQYTSEEDITYYGIYKKKVTLTYKKNSNEENIPESVSKYVYLNIGTNKLSEVEITLDEGKNIKKTNSIFKNWKDDKNTYGAGSKIKINEDRKIEAEWTENGCKVIFDYESNGGTSADITSMIYYYDDSEPIDLSNIRAYKPGWEFIGWSKYEEAEANPLTKYQPNDGETEVTLYAMYKKVITVTYKITDTTAFSLTSKTKEEYTMYNKETEYEIELAKVINIKNQMTFLGWNIEKDAITGKYNEGEKIKISENTTLYGIIRNENEVKVVYNYYEAGERKKIIKTCKKYNGSNTCITDSGITTIEYDKGIFIGWSKSENEINIENIQEVSEDVNYYAVYDKLITLSYISGVNSSVTSSEIYKINMLTTSNDIEYIKIDVELDIPDAIEGYETNGWREDEIADVRTYQSGEIIKINKDTKLNGVYKKEVILSYDCKDALETLTSDAKIVYYNTTIKDEKIASRFLLEKSVTRVGYDFVGWKINSQEYNIGSTANIVSSTIAEPKWKAKIYQITYDYKTNGGSNISTHPTEINYGEKVDITPIAIKDGYEFIGWNTDKNATSGLSEIEVPANDFTVYAIFRKKIEANWILIDPDAGENKIDKTSCYRYNNDETCKIETGIVIPKSEYIMEGWGTVQGGIDVVAANNYYYDISENTNFYSITRKKTPIVGTFYYGSDDEINRIKGSCILYNGNTSCEIKEPLTPTIYKETGFKAWSSDKYNYRTSSMKVSIDTTYYAHYVRTVALNYHTGESNTIKTYTNTVEYILSDVGDHEIIPTYELIEPDSIDTYTTLGWRLDDERTETDKNYTIGTVIDLRYTTDLNSVYKRNITINYDVGEGSPTPESKTEVQYYNSISGASNHLQILPASEDVSRTGWTLVGWREDSETGEKYAPLYNYYLYKTTTMYAEWERNKYNLTISGSYITASENPVVIQYGLTRTITLTPNTKYYIQSISCDNGYTMTGYSTGKTAYNLQTVTIKNNNVTKDGTCTITMVSRNYDATPSTYDCNCKTEKVCETVSYCCETASDGCSNCCTKYCYKYNQNCKDVKSCSTCTKYSCPDGGTLSGTTCVF